MPCCLETVAAGASARCKAATEEELLLEKDIFKPLLIVRVAKVLRKGGPQRPDAPSSRRAHES